MATFLADELATLCRLLVKQFVNISGQNSLPLDLESSLLEITTIAAANLRAGRLARQNRARASSHQLTLPAYVEQLIPIWATEYPQWCSLQAHKTTAWRKLEQDLTVTARRLLRNRPLAGAFAFTAEDHVQRACLNIVRNRYPFDVPLLLWTRAILKNTIREMERSGDALDRWHSSLDTDVPVGSDPESFNPSPEFVDRSSERAFNRIGQREALLCALARLTPLRQSILILSFFEGLSDADIAKKLDISMTHLYSARHRALKQLSKLSTAHAMRE